MQLINPKFDLSPPLIKGGLGRILGAIKSSLTPLFQKGGIICAIIFFASVKTFAAIDPYQFDNETQHERYQHFIEEMRCPKCQNQNLAGSDAPIAKDLRHELQRLVKEGKSDREITAYMVSRYGEFILYDPPFDAKTAALWGAPIAFVVIGLGVLINVARRRAGGNIAAELSAEERAKLEQLLHEDSVSETKNNSGAN